MTLHEDEDFNSDEIHPNVRIIKLYARYIKINLNKKLK